METPTRTQTPSKTQSVSAKGPDLPPFVFVHLGPYPEFFPDFMSVAVRQVARWNPGISIHVIVPRVFLNRTSVVEAGATPNANVTLWAAEDIPQSAAHVLFHAGTRQNTAFRGGFWKVTTERLFTLSDFLDWRGYYEAVHQENDNLIYFTLSDHITALRAFYPGLTMTPHATAGLMYVGNRFRLAQLAETMTNATADEMLMVGWFQERYGEDAISALPIVAPADVGWLPGFTRHFADFNGIFDGAPHGQYICGPDPRNGHGGPGFVNPQSPYSPKDFEYEWTFDEKKGLRHMRMRKRLDKGGKGEWRRILHLHMHCKNLTGYAS